MQLFFIKDNNIISEEVLSDLSNIKTKEEIEDLRSLDSKTYLKENGMYETKFFNEQIHYLDNGVYKEIDNSLQLINNNYINKANSYLLSLPKVLDNNKEISLKYKDNEIKLYYEYNNINSILNNNISRDKINLNDEITYNISNNETLQYILKQNSIKENIILNSYINNYNYSYFIDTSLRVERIGNEIYFYDSLNEVFKMNEYVMIDANNNKSFDINLEIEVIDNNTYKLTITPSNTFLLNASYPVVIDPEITLIDGGVIDGITTLTSIDKKSYTTTSLTLGSFSLNNRSNNTLSDDLIAKLDVYIPRIYNTNISNIITNNQLMYANITFTTLSTNALNETNVLMKYDNNIIDSVSFHNTTVFNHKFNIIDAINDNIESFKTNDINLSFELSVEGVSNTNVTYSLGNDLGGNKPIISLGYIDEAGIYDYYTYETLPLSNESNIYIAHNSGNLTYIYNDYNDNNLLNLSHIYNANRKHEENIFGNGFNLNYNETISTNSSSIVLTKGNGNKIIFYPLSTNTYLSNDGSGDELNKLLDINNNIIGYEIKSDGGIKEYNSLGKLTKIYIDENDRDKQITINYENNRISEVIDSYESKIEFTYLTVANDPSTSQVGISYLAYLEVYKKDSNNVYKRVQRVEFEYIEGALISICEYKNSTQGKYTYLNYNNDNHIERIYKHNNGYNFLYDNNARLIEAKVYSTNFNNGETINFEYSKNGYKTIVTQNEKIVTYSFDKYYHTTQIEDSNGYTNFIKYEDIYFDNLGNVITCPNYYLNHKIKVKSNTFKNTINQIINHGFEIKTNNDIYGWNRQVSDSSTASILSNSYLYGSNVLKLYKSNNGISQVYQDIDVKQDSEYIVSCYIKNVNDGTGAYIDVIGLDGSINLIQRTNNIKLTNDFVRYEYKFISNYTGKLRIKLVNESNGTSYFDNVQINTNYIDTRYNYLENSSFENNDYWNGDNYVITNNEVFSDLCGDKLLKLETNGYVSQTINVIGESGDIFVFGGYTSFENYTGNVIIKLSLLKQNGIEVSSYTLDGSTISSNLYLTKIKAEDSYNQVKIEIINNSLSSDVYIDNLAIYKEGYGINLSYLDNGLIEEEYNELSRDVSTYTYDENKNLISITTTLNDEENVITLDYDENNNLTTITKDNISSNFVLDTNGNITKVELTSQNSDVKIYNFVSTYTLDGLYPNYEEDVYGNTYSKTYDVLTGLLTYVIDSNDIYKSYEYDKNSNITKLINGKGTNKKEVTYTYDINGNITSITSEGITYYYTYNDYNDIKSITIGDELLLTYNYQNELTNDEYSGLVDNKVYSYGTISFIYDSEGRIKEVYEKNYNEENEELVLSYIYNDYSEIASYTDYKENVTYYYNYDYQNRLINVNSTNGNNITYEYDINSNLINKTNINGSNLYTYNNESLISENISNNYNINYQYDSFKQLEVINYYINSNQISKSYTYETTIIDEDTYYTGRIKEFSYNLNNLNIKYVYIYDEYNNITHIQGYENNVLKYEEINDYDIYNQIVLNEVHANGVNIGSEFAYNSRGNIECYFILDLNTMQTINSYSFTYKEEGNIDKLVKVEVLNTNEEYNINYSNNNEVSLYLGYNLSYDMNHIISLLKGEDEINYTYNANGIRTSKEIITNDSNTNITYILDGTNIIKEIKDNNVLEYFYDSNDEVIGFTYNNQKYLYLKNLQKDIIGIVDSNGNVVVKYYYSAYGKVINKVDTSGINLSVINPFRYRSYYQDDEIGWYYLNNRYYDPITLRFITMDDVDYLGASGSVLSYNLYSYCENNPVINVDYDGTIPVHIIASVVMSIAWNVIPRIIGDVIKGKMSKISDYIGDIVSGTISGLIASMTGNSTLGSFFGTFFGELTKFLIINGPSIKINNFGEVIKNMFKILAKAFISMVCSIIAGNLIKAFSGKSFSSKQIKNYFKNTKYLKSAFGIGSGGKTAQRMWIADAGITTVLYNIMTSGI